MQKTKKYYGIYLNDEIPKLDKKNKYHKEVEIKFEGKAYLLEKKEENQVEKIEIENEYKLKKEGDYEIEFINLSEEKYHLQVRIETSGLLFILLLLLLGLLILFLFTKPIDAMNSPFDQFCDYINLAILQLDVEENKNKEESFEEQYESLENQYELPENQYEFDLTLKEIASQEIHLISTIQADGSMNRKVAPGDRGCFSIVMNTKKSMEDMKYSVKFQDLSSEKPQNMFFQIRGKNQIYSTLQELEKELNGIVKKQSYQTILIDWQWRYETGENEESIYKNDEIDTKEGESLNDYQFKIIVTGEEVQ